jgi:hypothetical protein
MAAASFTMSLFLENPTNTNLKYVVEVASEFYAWYFLHAK